MRALLDTHAFLWWNMEDPQLSPLAREIIADGRNEIFLSAASVWEISIKAAKGKLVLPEPPAQYIANRMGLYRFQPLLIQVSHAARVYDLPHHHDDPFDRMLIAQSQIEGIPLLSADPEIRKYEVEVIW
jgi:PIN domain nuclease of toxin-antitoxin system